jgi:LuxR family maltose regulon positive regulatory protein
MGESTSNVRLDAEPLLLAEAKLAAPRHRASMLTRRRVWDTLDSAADAALTLVSAPAGYGKTTAVRSWSAQRDSAQAWVTLDVGDNDPARLWSYVATAIDRIRGGLGRRALHRLRASGMQISAAVDELMNGIADFGAELELVLDDFHTVTDRECIDSVAFAIERLPPTARVILITRADPDLGLARLRARGALAELRADELAFTADEARELLVDRGRLPLDDEDVATLVRRTEGWPAALYLAALWLRAVPDPQRAVRSFGGDQRYVAEYLSHEVLGALNRDEHEFVLQVAVLGRFTAELCDAVLGRSDSAQRLAELEQSNLFVLRLERDDWIRVHALFAQFAAARLAALQPGAATEIHGRAARWLRARGLVIEALEHAAAGSDHDLVADLLTEDHASLIANGRSVTLLRWVRTLPDECLVERPELAAAAATAATLVGGAAIERRRYLGLARRASAERPERFDAYARGAVAMVRAGAIDFGVEAAVSDGHGAVELAENGPDDALVAALAALAEAEYFAGDLAGAWWAAWRASEHPDAARRVPGYALARSVLALVAVDRGWLGSARRHANEARAIVGRIMSSRSWLGAHAAVALGAVHVADGDLGAAEREFSYAERFFQDDVATVHHAHLLVRLADVQRQRGRLDDADATLIALYEAMDELGDCGVIPERAATVERDLKEARRQASGGELLRPPSDAELAVLRLLGSDLSAREIADELFLSPNTIRSHTRAIYRKLGVSSRPEAVARATAVGLLG